jgi:hypothetical protein
VKGSEQVAVRREGSRKRNKLGIRECVRVTKNQIFEYRRSKEVGNKDF